MAFNEFKLPNGTTLKNRIVKAALEEFMADVEQHCQPSGSMLRLYEEWGKGGAGLILSGHIMIDPLAVAASGDTLLAKDACAHDEGLWRKWVEGTRQNGAQFWFQINHPGRQMKLQDGMQPSGPSEIPVKMGNLSSMFGKPRAMTEDDIRDVIDRFAWTAKRAEELGADGVEIHAAHGYLISQFLSPLANVRTDRWGGSRENRARLLFETIKAVRAAVSPRFGVGLKINTADFQRGGFDNDDLLWIVEQLNDMRIDIIELSGGNYESPVMLDGKGIGETNSHNTTSTALREAYFFQAAEKVIAVTKVPLVVTGGIRTRATLDAVVSSSDILLAGMGTALGLVPDLPNRWMRGEDPAPQTSKSWLLPKMLTGIGHTAAVHWNMRAIGTDGRRWQGVWPSLALLMDLLKDVKQTRQYQKWVKLLSQGNRTKET